MAARQQTRSNAQVALLLSGVVLGMIGLAFASVPLYRLFCQVTGFGGTPQVASEMPETVGDRVITVRFNADVNPALPAIPIKLYGPPPTSATREAFADIVLAGGCQTVAGIDRLKADDAHAYHQTCHLLRQDGAFVEVGESDNLIVNKLRVDDRAFGLFGFTYLDQNIDVLHGSRIDGTAPTFEAIADGRYALSRALYIYVKPDHVRSIPGIVDFVAEITSDKAGGDFGYLTDKGFIPLELTERAQARAKAQSLATGRL